jgi:hypothetical protein
MSLSTKDLNEKTYMSGCHNGSMKTAQSTQWTAQSEALTASVQALRLR